MRLSYPLPFRFSVPSPSAPCIQPSSFCTASILFVIGPLPCNVFPCPSPFSRIPFSYDIHYLILLLISLLPSHTMAESRACPFNFAHFVLLLHANGQYTFFRPSFVHFQSYYPPHTFPASTFFVPKATFLHIYLHLPFTPEYQSRFEYSVFVRRRSP